MQCARLGWRQVPGLLQGRLDGGDRQRRAGNDVIGPGLDLVIEPVERNDRIDHAKGIKQFRTMHSVLSPAELTFYLALSRAVGDNYIVLPKVCLADLIRPSRRLNTHAQEVADDRTRHERVECVIVRRDTLAIWCVIELDPPPRSGEARYRAEVLAAAELPAIPFASRLSYDPDGIRQGIFDALRADTPITQEYPLPLSSVV